jgi:REP element-mobilizing transposase RayT
LIDDKIQEALHGYLGGICRQLECHPVQIGGYNDHVHILCNLSKKITVIKLLEEIKKNSSKWMKTKGDDYSGFYWQDGYAAFSVSHIDLEAISEYIRNQHKHHNEQTYQDECRALFKKYNIEYDEKYVWD